MALSATKNQIVTTGTGYSVEIFLPEKENGQDWSLSASASSWGSATLQNSADRTNWGDTLDQTNTAVTFTANKSVRVQGNMSYRINVSSHAAAITILAK